MYIVMPSVHLNVSRRTVYIGDNVTIYCRGHGYPLPSTSLFMPNGSVFSVMWPKEFKSTIEIGQFSQGGGVYSCSSINKYGAATETMTINGVHYVVFCY